MRFSVIYSTTTWAFQILWALLSFPSSTGESESSILGSLTGSEVFRRTGIVAVDEWEFLAYEEQYIIDHWKRDGENNGFHSIDQGDDNFWFKSITQVR